MDGEWASPVLFPGKKTPWPQKLLKISRPISKARCCRRGANLLRPQSLSDFKSGAWRIVVLLTLDPGSNWGMA